MLYFGSNVRNVHVNTIHGTGGMANKTSYVVQSSISDFRILSTDDVDEIEDAGMSYFQWIKESTHRGRAWYNTDRWLIDTRQSLLFAPVTTTVVKQTSRRTDIIGQGYWVDCILTTTVNLDTESVMNESFLGARIGGILSAILTSSRADAELFTKYLLPLWKGTDYDPTAVRSKFDRLTLNLESSSTGRGYSIQLFGPGQRSSLLLELHHLLTSRDSPVVQFKYQEIVRVQELSGNELQALLFKMAFSMVLEKKWREVQQANEERGTSGSEDYDGSDVALLRNDLLISAQGGMLIIRLVYQSFQRD